MYLFSRIASQAPEVLVTLLIFSLSSGVLGGVMFYMDSVGPDVMDEMSEGILIDMEVYLHASFYDQNDTTLADFMDLIDDQQEVEAQEPVGLVQIYDSEEADRELQKSKCLGIENSFLENYPSLVRLGPGSLPLNDTSCYVLEERFLAEEMQIGDNYTVSVPITSGPDAGTRMNRTFTIVGTYNTDLLKTTVGYSVVGRWGLMETAFKQVHTLFMVTTRDGLWNQFGELQHDGDNSIHDRIWVKFDTDALVRGDPLKSAAALKTVENRVEQRTLPLASIERFELIDVLYEYSTWATSMRVIALAFTIPSLVMGVMLVQYNSDLLADQRRRNVGAIKTRGASGTQAFSWILGIVLFTGVIGSIGAVIAGSLAALLSGTIRELMVFDLTQLSSFELILWPQSIAGLIIFSFALGFGVGIPIAVKALLMTPAEAHGVLEREALGKEEKMANPLVHGGVVGISGALLIPLLSVLNDSSLSLLGSMLFSTAFVALLAVFIVGLTLLLSRPAASAKSRILSRIRNKKLVVGVQLMGRTGRVLRRSESYAVMFIAMVFTAGVFSSLAATTGSNHMKALFEFETGADIVVDVQPGLENVTSELLEEVRAIEGVSHAAGILRVSGRAQFWMDWASRMYRRNESMTFYGVDGDDFSRSAFLMPYFTYYDIPSTSLVRLDENHTKVITSFKPIIDYDRNFLQASIPVYTDQITLEIRAPNAKYYMNHTIVDVMADDPGGYRPSTYGAASFQADTYLPGYTSDYLFAVVNLEYLQALVNSTRLTRLYVDLEPGANYTKIMDDIVGLAPYSFASIRSPLPSIDSILDTRAGQSIYGAYSLNILFSLIYVTAGMTLVMTAKVRKMRKHFSLLRALGTEPQAIIRAVSIDVAVGLAFGIAIGSAVGYMLTLIVLGIPVTYLGLSEQVSWQGLPVSVAVPIELVLGVVIISFVVSLMATYLVMRRGLSIDIAEDLSVSE